jgi:membrane-associated protease RseP (regulator of RpoE activity)
MVLKRALAACALVATVAVAADAQPGRVGRGFPLDQDRVVPVGRGGPRPLVYGFALECTGCSRSEQMSGAPPVAVWHYTEYPRVVRVAPGGSAESAGVKEGDVITAIDGMSLLTYAGALRFSAVRAGDSVTLTVDRKAKGKLLDLKLVLQRGPLATLRPSPVDPRVKQFTSRVGDTDVDVWGNDPVVTSTDSTGATIITIGGTTVRIAPRPGPRKFSRPLP